MFLVSESFTKGDVIHRTCFVSGIKAPLLRSKIFGLTEIYSRNLKCLKTTNNSYFFHEVRLYFIELFCIVAGRGKAEYFFKLTT